MQGKFPIEAKYDKAKEEYDTLVGKEGPAKQKTDEIAKSLYDFVIKKNLRNLLREGSLTVIYYGEALSSGASILELAVKIKKTETLTPEIGGKWVSELHEIAKHSIGSKDVVWGGIKLGIGAVILLGALTGIIVGAVLLANPTMLLLLLPLFFIALGFGVSANPFRDFHNRGFSKEIDDLAVLVQTIIGEPDTDPAPALPRTKGDSFASVYQPQPDTKKTDQISVQTTSSSKSDPNP